MPKKSVVASSDGNFSPVNRRTASFVRRVRHLRGEIGDELNNLAVKLSDISSPLERTGNLLEMMPSPTFLENSGAIKLDHGLISIFILFHISHFDVRVSIPQDKLSVANSSVKLYRISKLYKVAKGVGTSGGGGVQAYRACILRRRVRLRIQMCVIAIQFRLWTLELAVNCGNRGN